MQSSKRVTNIFAKTFMELCMKITFSRIIDKMGCASLIKYLIFDFPVVFPNKILHIHAIFVRKLKHHQLNRVVEYIKSFWMIFFVFARLGQPRTRLFHFRFEWNKNPIHVYTSTYRMSVRPLAWCDWYVLAFIEYIEKGEMERDQPEKIFNMIMSNNLLSINKWCVVQSNSCW